VWLSPILERPNHPMRNLVHLDFIAAHDTMSRLLQSFAA